MSTPNVLVLSSMSAALWCPWPRCSHCPDRSPAQNPVACREACCPYPPRGPICPEPPAGQRKASSLDGPTRPAPHLAGVPHPRQSPPHETPRLLQNQYCVSHVRPAPPPSRADQACAPAAPLKAQLGLTVTRGGGGRAGHAFPGPPHAGWSGGCHSFLGQGWTLSGPQGCAGGPRTAGHTHTPLCASISCFPMASVTKAVPFRMMSVMVLHALGDSLSVGEMKLPAALLITICRGTRGYRDFEVRRHVRPRGRFCPKPRRGPIRDDARRVNTWPLSSSPLQSPMFLPNSSPSSFLKIRVESIKENRNRRSMPATRRHFTCL